jgi:PAS domain S-box-containing protein
VHVHSREPHRLAAPDRRVSEQLRLAIEAAPTGMLMADSSGRIVLVNARAEKLFGFARQDLLGRPIDMLVPERLRGSHPFHAPLDEAGPGAIGAGHDLRGRRSDGTEISIEIGHSSFHTPVGDFVLCSVVDVSERQRSERERERLLGELRTLNAELEQRVDARTAELQAALREREVLLQEVHHRVKNNLQVISSLISMQLRTLASGAGRHELEECRTRVQAIALIHEKLYQSQDYARVPFPEYARGLASFVFEATGVASERVVLQLSVADVALAVDKAIPCGLILNELITNALKHGFPDGRSGTVRVELAAFDAGGLRLVVSDDGVGLPRDLDFERSESLGLQLVRMLAKQLEASLEVVPGRGTTFRLTVPGEA